MNSREILAWNYLKKQFQRMECDCITSNSTRKFSGIQLNKAGNAHELRTEGIHPTPCPLGIMVSLLIKIILEREE